MEIPADAILLEANEITTDESAMTGETDPINKNIIEICLKKKHDLEIIGGKKGEHEKHEIPSPILLSGTKILSG
jgi:magnesium-transporting ATPase (P-type)